VCDFSAQALWATTPTSAFFGPATHKKMYVSPAAFALLSLLLLLLSSTLMTEAKTCTNLDEDQDSEDDDCSGCDVGLFIDDIKNQKGTAVVRHECTACPPGFFSDTEGKEDCTAHTQCPAGKYFTLAPTNQFDRICQIDASVDAQIDASVKYFQLMLKSMHGMVKIPNVRKQMKVSMPVHNAPVDTGKTEQ